MRSCETPLVRNKSAISDAGHSELGSTSEMPVDQPRVTMETLDGLDYLLDIRPVEGPTLVNVRGHDPTVSGSICLVASFDRVGMHEITPDDRGIGGKFEKISPDHREHVVRVDFGNGGPHRVEIDVGNGRTVNCPGSYVSASLLDYSWTRSLSVDYPKSRFNQLTSRASVALGRVNRGNRTTRVYCPYQVTVNFAAPPTMSEHLEALATAVSIRRMETLV